MTVQKILFPKTEYEDMYVRGGIAKEGALHVRAGDSATFDTYFGCFSYTKWRDYTRLAGVTLSLTLEGRARVALCSFDGVERREHASLLTDGGECTLSVDFDALPPLGILYPVIEAILEVRLIKAEYITDAERDEVRAAIAFCTFRRERALGANVEILAKERPSMVDRVIVVDNGGTLDEEEIACDYVRLVKNPNYGGSAGFTRGIIEAKAEGFTHVILMDDDVIIYPDAISRMTSFVSLLDEEHKNAHVSAAMLYATRPYMQHELGARFEGDRIKSLKTGLDTREPEALVENMRDEGAEYGAWWCFMLPLEDTDRFGLPLPLFIKFDDVEYGMRTTGAADAPIITLNGVCVRHDDFDLKYSMHLEYYNIRNQLIMRILRSDMSTFGAISRLIKATVKHLFLYRYDAMDTVLRAFDDLLGGAEGLMERNAEELNSSLIKNAPRAQELSSIEGWRSSMRNFTEPPKTTLLKKLAIVLTLGGHLVPSFLLKKEIAAFPLPDAKIKCAFLRRRTIQYQLGSDQGYLLVRSFGKFVKGAWRAHLMMWKLLFRFGKAKRSFKENEKTMTSPEFWSSYLGLSEKELDPPEAE